MFNKHDLLHNIKPTKPCPIKWDDMNGGDVVRTCGKCGALVLNEQETDSQKFSQVISKHKDPKQKCIYRRTDGKLMLRHCGPEPRGDVVFHSLCWTGCAALVFVALNFFLGWDRFGVVLPTNWFVSLYIWNIIGACLLFKIAPSSVQGRVVMFVFIAPMVLLNVFSFTALALHIYWDLIFPAVSANVK